MKILFLGVSLMVWFCTASAQTVYMHISNTAIYEFLDEMASEKLIEVNTAVKPWSRSFIANKLHQLDGQRALLNNRQQKDLDFYLKDFNKELKPGKNFDKRLDAFYYKDSLFTMSINPIVGLDYYSNPNGKAYHRWNGAELFSYVGSHWAFYANLRDNHESKIMTGTTYLVQETGAKYKLDNQGIAGDYSEMRGGLSYSWNWGNVAMVKDHFAWGEGYNGTNIFSGHTPSFAQIKLQIKPVWWFELNYVHGWLVSEVLDSSLSYSSNEMVREVYYSKYLACNFFTFNLTKRIALSVGNSIVYSDIGVQPAYLIPFLFYKSVDHTYNGMHNATGQNSQMFGSLSIRSIKHLHLYSSLFIDELSLSRMFNPSQQSNYVSIKAGMKIDNWIINNTGGIFEYTRTNPMVYKHNITTTTFESNRYNMGYYLRDNSQEYYLTAYCKPARSLKLQLSYTKAQKGEDYPYINDNSKDVWGLPFMKDVIWQHKEISAKIEYQIFNDIFLTAEIQKNSYSGDTKTYNPPYYTNGYMYIGGLNWGF